MLIHRTALELYRSAAEEEDGRYAIACIQIEPSGRVSATDGHHFVQVEALVDEPDLFTESELAPLPLVLPTAVIIPADIVKAFAAAVRKKKKAKESTHVDAVLVAYKDGGITLATADGKTVRRFIVQPDERAQFPQVNKIRPHGEPTVKLTLAASLLTKMLGTMKACGVETIDLDVFDARDPVFFSALGERGYLRGAIMPMRRADSDDVAAPAPLPTDPAPAGVDLETGEIRDADRASVVDAVLQSVADGTTAAAREFVEKNVRRSKRDGSSVKLSVGGRSVVIDANGARALEGTQ